MDAKRRRLDAPAGVASLGVFSRISVNTVETVINRVRANPGCLVEGPQCYKKALATHKNKLRKELEIVIDVPLKKGTFLVEDAGPSWPDAMVLQGKQRICRKD